MDQLPPGLFTSHILPYVGDNQFRYIAGVDRSFREAYSKLYPRKQTHWNVIATLKHVQLCYKDLLVQSQAPPSRQEIVQTILLLQKEDARRPQKKCLRKQLFTHCVKTGQFDAVQYLHQIKCPRPNTVCSTAARHGHVPLLTWLRAQGAPWVAAVCASAAAGGHLCILEGVRELNCPWDKRTTDLAAANGHVELLEWAVDNGCPLQTSAYIAAAKQGHLPVVRWLHRYGLPWDSNTLAYAALYGHLDVLKWAYKNGCKDNMESICQCAAIYGHLEVLKWAHENDCPWDEEVCTAAATQGEGTQVILWGNMLTTDRNPNIPRQNFMNVLRYAHENGCPWNAQTCGDAAYMDNLELLEYAHENGCPWDQETCSMAAMKGNLSIVKYAHENGCPWDASVCANAALHGCALGLVSNAMGLDDEDDDDSTAMQPMILEEKYLEVLKYAHENGCPWDEGTCSNAALTHFALLQYAHENGCPWNRQTCYNAASSGNLQSLKYAHENGCPWDKKCCTIAAEKGHLEILQYLMDQGCPWDHALVPDNDGVPLQSLIMGHRYGFFYIECPSLGPLKVDRAEELGVLGTQGVQVQLCHCERRVLRMFFNPRLDMHSYMAGRKR